MIAYALSQLTIAFFGLPVVLHPVFRRETWPVRIVVAFVAGSVLLTLEAMVLSYGGVTWGERTLPVPVLIAAAYGAWKWRGKGSTRLTPVSSGWSPGAVFVVAVAVVHIFAATLVTRGAVSYESNIVEGAKGARMAEAGSVMFSWRASADAAPLRTADPPLVEITRAWSDLVLQRETWSEAPAATLLWFALALMAVQTLMRRGANAAVSWRVAFWAIAMANAIVIARAAGTADVPFICFTTIAALALRRADASLQLLGTWSLIAMVLTRPEGVVYALVLSLFSPSKAKLQNALTAVSAAALWFVPAAAAGVMLPFRPSLSLQSVELIAVSSFGLAVVLPLIMLVRSAARDGRAAVTELLPLLLLAAAVPSAAALMQLPPHHPAEPRTARAFLPLMSITIVLAADLTRRGRAREPLAVAPAAD